MLVSFETKFIRRDQKQRSNGEACSASQNEFQIRPDELDYQKTLTWFSIYCALYLLMLGMCYDINQ